MVFFTALTPVLATILLAWLLFLGRPPKGVPPDFEAPSVDDMRRQLLFGLFYVNPQDPRGWVPKIYGFGYTVNFRTNRNATIFALLILATLASALAQVLCMLGCAQS